MAVENLTATWRGPLSLAATRQVATKGMQIVTATVEATAAASATSTYWMARLPTGARIIGGMSKVYFDDLASTGSPTLDIGLFAVDANFADNDDALNDGIDVATAAGSATVVKGIADYGKRVWEYAGETSDPGGFADLKLTLKDAAVNTGGTITMELAYVVD